MIIFELESEIKVSYTFGDSTLLSIDLNLFILESFPLFYFFKKKDKL